jgi:hypothetical protein
VRPERERTVDFYGDPIQVAQSTDGTLYVALRPISDFLGLDFSSQRHRVLRDEVMAERLTSVLMTAADGRQREQLCLPLDLLPGWLFGVSPRQARPEIAEKLKRYRTECFRVLWQAFAGETASIVAVPTAAPVPTTENVALEHIERMALAIAQMAREQRAFEQQVDTRFTALQASLQTELAAQHTEVMGRLDQAAAIVGSLMRRVNAVEGMVTSGATISETQAAEISALVRSIAGELAQRGVGKNPYQGVFSALYRQFRVSSYHNIPAKRFGEVMAWLRDYQETLDAHGDEA